MKFIGIILAIGIIGSTFTAKPANAGIGTCFSNLQAGMLAAGYDWNTASEYAMDVCVYNWRRRLSV